MSTELCPSTSRKTDGPDRTSAPGPEHRLRVHNAGTGGLMPDDSVFHEWRAADREAHSQERAMTEGAVDAGQGLR